MTLTPSKMVPLGTEMPAFELLNTKTRKEVLSEDLLGEKGTLVVFFCNHCPFVVHVAKKLAEMVKIYQKKGIKTVLINSNDAKAYPSDAPELMPTFAAKYQFRAPYLWDSSQAVAKSFSAACTPDFFLYDDARKLVYRGQMDASRPGNGVENDGKDLTDALEALLSGQPPLKDQKPSMGCNIKETRVNDTKS